ncbi:MAG: PEP-CTERM sorting domain-containing protein [Candidatus Eiseniibacteriota bacterium]
MNVIAIKAARVLAISAAAAALSVSTALAVPAPSLMARPAGLAVSSQGPSSSSLIVGGSKSFGSALTAAQGSIGISVVPSNGYAPLNDSFRRAKFVQVNRTSDVPEPASFWLLGTGLAAMLLLSLRKRRTA